MYTVILDQGVVIRNSDGVVVSPVESADDPKFIEYNTWVNNGGQPLILDTMGGMNLASD